MLCVEHVLLNSLLGAQKSIEGVHNFLKYVGCTLAVIRMLSRMNCPCLSRNNGYEPYNRSVVEENIMVEVSWISVNCFRKSNGFQ